MTHAPTDNAGMSGPSRTAVLVAAVALIAIGIGLLVRQWRSSWGAGDDLNAVQRRIETLEAELAAAESAPDPAASYRPQVAGDITAIDAPASDILRQLPSVASVERLVTCPRPTHRLIHFRDWHHAPRDLYALDLANVLGRQPTDEELNLRHRELLLQVALVQLEQATALRCLVRHHGLRQVLSEGLTAAGLDEYRADLATLGDADRRLAALRKDRAALKDRAAALDRDLAEPVRGHREQLLPYGAPGRLVIDGAAAVLPLDDEAILQAARPFRTGAEPEAAALAARHAWQVKAAMASGPVAVFVLGASHDLSAAACAQAGGGIEYIRVTTAAVERFAGTNEP